MAQLLFNFEGFLLDNIAHNGRFKLNYPLLFPKFTIKLSIKTGSDSSSSLSEEALIASGPECVEPEEGATDRQVGNRLTDTPSTNDPRTQPLGIFLEPKSKPRPRICSVGVQFQ